MSVADNVLARAAKEIGYYAPDDPQPGSEAGRCFGQLELVSSGLLDRPTLFAVHALSACVWTSAGRLTLLEDSP